jgi:endo-1,4-beta-D-glucanase Y
MRKDRLPRNKILLLIGIVVLYALIAAVLATLVSSGAIQRSPPTVNEPENTDTAPEVSSSSILPHLQAAQRFLDDNLVGADGHVQLYLVAGNDTLSDHDTNSEAASYYLLWTAQEGDKERFDKELRFMETKMMHPKLDYLMWRLDANGSVEGDGANIATDADLRAIKALLIAEKRWPEERYTKMIDRLAEGMEKVAITKDGYLAPYGGVSGTSSTWTADEVWLSYADFTVLKELAARKGPPWNTVYAKMRQASLDAQLENGLYNPMLVKSRQPGNDIDDGGYSINSMWMMVRNAESADPDLMRSANRSLRFYKDKFRVDAELYAKYGSDGDALSSSDTPWVYALVGRAAIALDDREFSEAMMNKLIEKQSADNSSRLFGAFTEQYKGHEAAGQFTMQESILTMQAFSEKENARRGAFKRP